MPNNQKQIQIELTPDVAGGTYSNLAIVAHSPSDFILDFASFLPGTPKAQIRSRIVMTPDHAKQLLKALQDNILKYEQQFGEIQQPGANTAIYPMGFGGGEA